MDGPAGAGGDGPALLLRASGLLQVAAGEEVRGVQIRAAAVIRGGRALFKMTGRKEHVDGLVSWF